MPTIFLKYISDVENSRSADCGFQGPLAFGYVCEILEVNINIVFKIMHIYTIVFQMES